MNRREAIALLGELNLNQLINPNLVVLEEKSAGFFQLRIRGDYSFKEIQMYLAGRFYLEENEGFLLIFSL